MHIDIFQIQCILPMIPAKDLRHVPRHEETKRRCEVEGGTDCGLERAEGDVAAVAGDDACRLLLESTIPRQCSKELPVC